MPHACLGKRLPRPISSPLFGDRERHGRTFNPADPMWEEWNRLAQRFYERAGEQTLYHRVIDLGYRVSARLDMTGKDALEIGPGYLPHARHWQSKPRRLVIADVRPEMLEHSEKLMGEMGVPCESLLVDRSAGPSLPIGGGSFDIVFTFYSLEHLHPIGDYLDEYRRLLRPGGLLVGAIPCEGGLAVGLSRYFTSRRWFRKNTTIDPDKLICWEHPTFADEILNALDERFTRRYLSTKPLPLLDAGLITSMIYERGGEPEGELEGAGPAAGG